MFSLVGRQVPVRAGVRVISDAPAMQSLQLRPEERRGVEPQGAVLEVDALVCRHGGCRSGARSALAPCADCAVNAPAACALWLFIVSPLLWWSATPTNGRPVRDDVNFPVRQAVYRSPRPRLRPPRGNAMFRAAEADSVVRYLSACSQEVARAIATSAETAAITSAAGVASMGSDGDPTSG